MTIEKRIQKIEDIVTKHLEESGTIRSDLKWLNKAFWTLTAAGLTFNTMLLVAIAVYLLNRK